MTEEASGRPLVASREQLAEDDRPVWDRIEESRGGVRGPFPALLNSPEVADRVCELGAYVRFEGVLPEEAKELAIITTARAFDCAYEWTAHERLAREAGVREEAIEAVANRAPVDDLAEIETTVVRFGRELFGEHEVGDATFEAARDRFGDRGVTELSATMGYYGMVACVLNAFDVRPEESTLP